MRSNFFASARIRALLALGISLCVLGGWQIASGAFTGPSANPPSSDGKLSIDGSGNIYIPSGTAIGFGGAPGANDATNASLAARLFTVVGNAIVNGRLVVHGDIRALTLEGYTGEGTSLGNITGASFQGALNASYLSAGVFGSSASKGNYTFQASATTDPVFFIDALNERVGVGNTNPQYVLDVSGTGRFTQPILVGTPTASGHATTKSYVDSAVTGGTASSTQTSAACDADATCEVNGIDANNGNITGVNKLTVSTIDPIYTIGGGRYATYMAGMTGVKEETSGTVRLQRSADGAYVAVLDFAAAGAGSDLWLFRHIADFGNGWGHLSVLLSPSFEGAVWYEKDTSGNRILIFGSPASASAPREISYRLTAPRFDHTSWPNIADPTDPSRGLFVQ